MWLCHNFQVFVQILGISLIKKVPECVPFHFALLLVTTADLATFKNMGGELLKMFAFGFPFDVLMNNLVENNNIITCYWQDQFRTCNIGHESEDRFAFGCELDEMLSQVFPQACIPPQLSSLSLMPYFRLLSCTHLSHIPCEARIRTRTVHQRKRERDECE